MVGIAGMVGGSIFVLTGPAIGDTGSGLIIAFILNGIITLFTAMVYAELGSAMPEAGGGYLWIREGLPRPNAFISGWMAWFAHIVAGSLYAVGFGAFVFALLQMAGFPNEAIFGLMPVDKVIAVLSIVAFTYVNIKGTSETGRAGTTVTIIQIATIVIIIGFGFWALQFNPGWELKFSEQMFPGGISGLVAAMGLTFIAFEGYEIIVQTGEEAKKPRRNIPRAIFISLAVVILLYCLMVFVAIAATKTPTGEPAWQFIGNFGELGIIKAVDLFMPYGGIVVLAGGIVSTLAALNATTFSSSRVAFAMGRNYNLPHALSAIHPINKTPYMATLVSGIIMAVMAYALPLTDIALAAGVIFLLLFTQVNAAAISIRRIYGDKLVYGFKTPLFPLIPIIGLILKIGLALYLLVTQPLSWAIAIIWIVVGFVLYRKYTFKKEVEHYAPVVTAEGTRQRLDYRILIPYMPENPDKMVKYAIRIAKEKSGEVNFLRTITVPPQTPLSAGSAFAESARKSFIPLERIFQENGVLCHYLVRISHDPTEALLATIEEQKINLLVADFETVRRNKKLLTLATCEFLAIKADEDELELEPAPEKSADAQAKRSLVVMYDGGPHAAAALKTASWLEHSGRFNVNLVSIVKKEESGSAPVFPDYLGQLGVRMKEVYASESSYELSSEVLDAVSTFQPDLVVMGATVGNFNVFYNPPLLSTLKQFHCPVIVAKEFVIPGVHKARSFLLRIMGK